jgi:hypothetical protein
VGCVRSQGTLRLRTAGQRGLDADGFRTRITSGPVYTGNCETGTVALRIKHISGSARGMTKNAVACQPRMWCGHRRPPSSRDLCRSWIVEEGKTARRRASALALWRSFVVE